MRTTTIIAVTLSTTLWAAPPDVRLNPADTLAIRGGKAGFSVATNALGIVVRGKSDALEGRVELHRTAGSLAIDHVDVHLPVKTLATGMTLRDEHMRKYVFTTSAGEVPDLRFEADAAVCPEAAAGRPSNCQITGMLAIRGVSKSCLLTLKIHPESGAYRVEGDGQVSLRDYGIEQPTQLGVKTANEIQIHLELTAKPNAPVSAHAGGVR